MDNPLEHILSHAHLNIKVRKLFISFGTCRTDIFIRGYVLWEIQYAPFHYQKKETKTFKENTVD